MLTDLNPNDWEEELIFKEIDISIKGTEVVLETLGFVHRISGYFKMD
jgi:hypothetical protein